MARKGSDIDNNTSLNDQLGRRYKIVVLDEESLGQAGAFSGSLLKYLTLGTILFLCISLFTVGIISFTPLRRLIPGYGDIEENSKFIKLQKSLEEIESTMEVQQTYIAGLQNMLSGKRNAEEVTGVEGAGNETTMSGSKQEIFNIDIQDSKRNRGLSQMYLAAPVLGTISAGFDINIQHYGVDILAGKGEAIKSVANGVVISSDWSLDAGNTISVQHDNNTISVYKHNSALLKKTGEYVKSGEAIAIIGNSGTLSDGPHLHLELWYEGSPVDPENYITF